MTARTATGETLTAPAIDSVNTFDAPVDGVAQVGVGDGARRPAHGDPAAEVGDRAGRAPVRGLTPSSLARVRNPLYGV